MRVSSTCSKGQCGLAELLYLLKRKKTFGQLCNVRDAAILIAEISMMNFAASLSKRVNLREVLHEVPVYSGASDASVGAFGMMFRRWATKKTGGSTKNGRDSNPKYLGVKKFGGERVIPGNIIVRQRGTRFHPGDYVGIGKDHTLFALKEGKVKFETHKLSGRKWVHIEPLDGHVVHPLYASASVNTQMNVAE